MFDDLPYIPRRTVLMYLFAFVVGTCFAIWLAIKGPEVFPSPPPENVNHLPIYSGGRNMGNADLSWRGGSLPGSQRLTYEVPEGDEETIFNFYRKALEQSGWHMRGPLIDLKDQSHSKLLKFYKGSPPELLDVYVSNPEPRSELIFIRLDYKK